MTRLVYGVSSTSSVADLTTRINEYLKNNPNSKVKEIAYSTVWISKGGAGDGVVEYSAIVLYEIEDKKHENPKTD
jgi:hypothetical protein